MSGQSSVPPPGAQQPGQVAGERHVSAVAGRAGGMSKAQGAALVATIAAALVGFVVLKPPPQVVDPGQKDDRLQIRSGPRYEAPPPLPATPTSFPIVPPTALAPALPTTQPALVPATPSDPLAKARRANLLTTYGNAAPGPPAAAPGNTSLHPGTALPNELAERLQPTPVVAVSASVLPHQPYLLTAGNTIPCTLQTAMDSTLPGFVSCIIPYDVRGKTGLTLLDRNTLVRGETRGSMQQGQERLFVLWTRAETPAGVVINLDSPAADPVGRTGLPGEIETHFWTRLKGALLLSIVQGGLSAGTSALGNSGFTNINTGNLQGVSSETLRNTVDIRPTLKLDQGATLSIQLARDLDFYSVYGMRTVQP